MRSDWAQQGGATKDRDRMLLPVQPLLAYADHDPLQRPLSSEVCRRAVLAASNFESKDSALRKDCIAAS